MQLSMVISMLTLFHIVCNLNYFSKISSHWLLCQWKWNQFYFFPSCSCSMYLYQQKWQKFFLKNDLQYMLANSITCTYIRVWDFATISVVDLVGFQGSHGNPLLKFSKTLKSLVDWDLSLEDGAMPQWTGICLLKMVPCPYLAIRFHELCNFHAQFENGFPKSCHKYLTKNFSWFPV